jgi:hypothetical protein
MPSGQCLQRLNKIKMIKAKTMTNGFKRFCAMLFTLCEPAFGLHLADATAARNTNLAEKR